MRYVDNNNYSDVVCDVTVTARHNIAGPVYSSGSSGDAVQINITFSFHLPTKFEQSFLNRRTLPF